MESIYFLAIVLGTAIGIAVGVGTFLSEMKERNERPQELTHFQEELQKAISKEEVTWEHIKLLARHHSVTSFGIKKTLEALASRVLTDENSSDEDFLPRIQEFLRELEIEQPFQGLPDDIQLHLQRIHEKLSENAHLLQPLAQHLKELLAERSVTQRRQRRVTYVSLAVGLGGFFVGILGYWI